MRTKYTKRKRSKHRKTRRRHRHSIRRIQKGG